MDPSPRLEVEAFFRRLFPCPTGHCRELRRIHPERGVVRQTFVTSIDAAVSAALDAGRLTNVYVGACPRAEARGNRGAIGVVTAAWADLDFRDFSQTDRVRGEQLARERLSGFDRQPTILVHSGNGLQCWWLYERPLEISEAWPVERFEAINRGIGKALGGDAVHDLPRVFRVPGTWNLPNDRKRQRGCVPVMARLLHADGPVFDPSDFRDLECAVTQSTRPRRDIPAPGLPTQDNAEILTAFQALLDKLGNGHPLSRTWRGDRVLTDTSRSGWDMALVNQLYKAGVREEFIPTLVRSYGFGRGVFATDAYVHGTMRKASSCRRVHGGTSRSA